MLNLALAVSKNFGKPPLFEYMCMLPLVSKTVVIRTVLQLINSMAKFVSPSTGTGLGGCFRCVKVKKF